MIKACGPPRGGAAGATLSPHHPAPVPLAAMATCLPTGPGPGRAGSWEQSPGRLRGCPAGPRRVPPSLHTAIRVPQGRGRAAPTVQAARHTHVFTQRARTHARSAGPGQHQQRLSPHLPSARGLTGVSRTCTGLAPADESGPLALFPDGRTQVTNSSRCYNSRTLRPRRSLSN